MIVESALSRRLFGSQAHPTPHVDLDGITIGLSRAAAVVLFAYFFMRLQGLIDSGAWALLSTKYGAWYLFEIAGFILIPSFLYAYGARSGRVRLLRGWRW